MILWPVVSDLLGCFLVSDWVRAAPPEYYVCKIPTILILPWPYYWLLVPYFFTYQIQYLSQLDLQAIDSIDVLSWITNIDVTTWVRDCTLRAQRWPKRGCRNAISASRYMLGGRSLAWIAVMPYCGHLNRFLPKLADLKVDCARPRIVIVTLNIMYRLWFFARRFWSPLISQDNYSYLYGLYIFLSWWSYLCIRFPKFGGIQICSRVMTRCVRHCQLMWLLYSYSNTSVIYKVANTLAIFGYR